MTHNLCKLIWLNRKYDAEKIKENHSRGPVTGNTDIDCISPESYNCRSLYCAHR